MNEQEIDLISDTLNLDLPVEVRIFLRDTRNLPKELIDGGDLIVDPGKIIELNKKLRAEGYYHLQWKDSFLAIGSDPGDCVYFFDLTSAPARAILADHDLDDLEDFSCLANSPNEFREYLHELAKDWAKQNLEIK